MNKKRITLSEQDLHRMVKMAVSKVLMEDYGRNYDYIKDNINRMVQAISQASNEYLQGNDESLLNTLLWQCRNFEQEYKKFKDAY